MLMPTIPHDAMILLVTNYFYISKKNSIFIIKYASMMVHVDQLIKQKFGIVVFDESNTKITEQNVDVANTIPQNAKRTILHANEQPEVIANMFINNILHSINLLIFFGNSICLTKECSPHSMITQSVIVVDSKQSRIGIVSAAPIQMNRNYLQTSSS